MDDKKNNYYNKTVEELYKYFETSDIGLTEEEAKKRLETYGENKLIEQKKKSTISLFFSQLVDFMVVLLVCAAIFSAVISYIRHESYIDSIVILIIVIINSILSFIQEKKADNAIQELNKMFVTSNYVIRNGVKQLLDVRNVVIGDIIELEAGDYISADARVVLSQDLEVNESTLTGESQAVTKTNNNIRGHRELYEINNMVFAGCNVSRGHAFVLVCATGMNTELGKIASSLLEKKVEITPLQKKVNQISKVITNMALIIILVMMVLGFIMGNDLFDILMLSISLAVAAIPEGLSSIITIILSLGMSAMAKRNVIIRKIASVETLGSTDIICSDKTGTITKNKMVVKNIYVNNKLYRDYDDITNADMLKYCASLCQNVVKNNTLYIGDETEVAIYKYLESINYPINNKPRIREYPFDSERKMMSTVNQMDDTVYSFTKGSLDSIINNCMYYYVDGKKYRINQEYKEKIFNIEKKLSAKSLRLLAFAFKDKKIEAPEHNMIFLGIIGMMDPPRESVSNAIATCHRAGSRPIMITGDSINTAIAIAKEVNIIDNDYCAIEGKYIDKMENDELIEAVNKYQVYARVTPNTKLRIVEALQSQGHIVAMTGDGVNDAPAIQKADIGIGMGVTGTEVVKKVADCILVDDSFSTIVDGVEEGRRITSNIKKVILYLLTGNILEVLLVFSSVIMNMEMFTTLQLLWINLVTDSIPAIMLAFEKSDKEIMYDKPANRFNKSFFTPFLVSRIVIRATIKFVVMIILFVYYSKNYDINIAGSLMFIFLIANELLDSLSCKNMKHSVLNRNLFSNKRLLIGLSIITIIQLVVFTTGLSNLFIVDNIAINNIFVILVISIMQFIIGEIIKPIYVKIFKDYVEVDKKC